MDHRPAGAVRPGRREACLSPRSPGPAALLEAVRAQFDPTLNGDRPLRVGVEAEVIPVWGGRRLPAPPREGTLPVLRELARRLGWGEEETPAGIPRFRLPDRSVISYEPGGQLEYASRAHASLDRLDEEAGQVLLTLAEAMEARGIHLLARGVDPRTPLEAAQLVLEGERYPRQRAHYDRRGPEGRAMMLQSAALHLNLDLGPQPVGAWTAANIISPLLVALFANSPERHGSSGPRRSQRSGLWRALDPTRTGLFRAESDPSPGYLTFALGAESFLLGDPAAPPRTFRDWLRGGVTLEDFHRHLTTLFPEVRPRGYLELRSVDALPARWCVVPAAVASALVHHLPTRARVLRELPPPNPDRLDRAGREGLGDPGILAEAPWVEARVLEGLRGLGREVAGPGVVRRVEEFFQRFTRQGLDPGSDPGERVEG